MLKLGIGTNNYILYPKINIIVEVFILTLQNLCRVLELPTEVIQEIVKYKKQYKNIPSESIYEQIKKTECWEQTIAELQEQIGEDTFGFHILAELLEYACRTYEEYNKLGISDSVFVSTMKFCTRFINEHKKIYGYYAFTWAWWFPRQLSMKEFRIGELEYEFVDGDTKKINIHIPSDARMGSQNIQKSFMEYRGFLHQYFPQWENIDWYCESWLLSPALEKLLPNDSNIIMFQKLFDIESVDYESMAVLDWVFPGEKGSLTDLSENTSLQRNMKRFLMSGNKVGWAKARIK